MQDPVNAIPNAQALFQRLNMNIARPIPIRLHDDQLHQFDDRRVGFGLGGRLNLGFGGGFGLGPEVDFAFGNVLEHVLNGVVRCAVIAGQRGFDFRQRGHYGLHIDFQDVTQTINRIHVHRVADCHGQRGIVFVDGNDLVAAGHMPGHHGNDFIGNAVFRQLDEIHSELAGERLRHIDIREFAPFEQPLQQAHATVLR